MKRKRWQCKCLVSKYTECPPLQETGEKTYNEMEDRGLNAHFVTNAHQAQASGLTTQDCGISTHLPSMLCTQRTYREGRK